MDFLEIKIEDQELIESLTKSIAEKTVDSKTAIQGLVLVQVLNFINNLIRKVDRLSKEFDQVEEYFYPRVYNPVLLAYEIINEKTLIAGYDNNSLLTTIRQVNNDIDGLRGIIDEKLKVLENANIVMRKEIGTKSDNEFCFDCARTEYLNQLAGFLVTSEDVIDTIKVITQDITNNLKVEIPTSKSSMKNAKRIRKLLTDTQAVARETELLSVYFLKDVLKEHGQIRRDYGEIQLQTNQILSKLSVSKGEVYLDNKNLGSALRMIYKSLKNIRGDLNALKIITIMAMRPLDNPIQTRSVLSSILDKGV